MQMAASSSFTYSCSSGMQHRNDDCDRVVMMTSDKMMVDSSFKGAMLLLQMKEQATKEVRVVSPGILHRRKIFKPNNNNINNNNDDDTSNNKTKNNNGTVSSPSHVKFDEIFGPAVTPEIRSRTISVCSFDMDVDHQVSKSLSTEDNDDEDEGEEEVVSMQEEYEEQDTDDSSNDNIDSNGNDTDGKMLLKMPQGVRPRNKSQHVGTEVKAPLKAVLKKKFSWKNFPILEGYLVEHRVKYLHYSSQLNYTGEQRVFNNQLTQGLLDLAAEEGFAFEEFTFAAVRDRIRCYYKSCVQAAKKKKRKKM